MGCRARQKGRMSRNGIVIAGLMGNGDVKPQPVVQKGVRRVPVIRAEVPAGVLAQHHSQKPAQNRMVSPRNAAIIPADGVAGSGSKKGRDGDAILGIRNLLLFRHGSQLVYSRRAGKGRPGNRACIGQEKWEPAIRRANRVSVRPCDQKSVWIRLHDDIPQELQGAGPPGMAQGELPGAGGLAFKPPLGHFQGPQAGGSPQGPRPGPPRRFLAPVAPPRPAVPGLDRPPRECRRPTPPAAPARRCRSCWGRRKPYWPNRL